MLGIFPKFCIYYNASKLQDFVESRSQINENTRVFQELTYVIDRLHIQGRKYPQTRNNPDKYLLLKNVNTMVCEQINFWASGYKHAAKHMNQTRFNFFSS